MTVVDLQRLDADVTEVETDICVVGSGAAGIALVQALLGTGLRVTLLEGGGRHREASSDDMYLVQTTGTLDSGGAGSRYRNYGGSTSEWGGQALPFEPHVFELRDWVNEGWLFPSSELTPWFGNAERLLQVGGLSFNSNLWQLAGVPEPAIDRNVFPVQFSKWSPSPRLGDNVWSLLSRSEDVQLFLHANLVGVVLSPDRARLEVFEARALNGRTVRVRCRVGVMACGGIETPRLLLACKTNDGHPWTVELPAVGSWFHDHLLLRIAEVEASDSRAFIDYFENFLVDGVKFAPRLPLAWEIQRRERTLDVGGLVLFESSARTGIGAAKSALRRLRRRDLSRALAGDALRAVGGLPEVARAVYRLKMKHRVANPRSSRFAIAVQMEQLPVEENHIRLSESRDALGLRRAVIESSLGPSARDTASVYLEYLDAEFIRSGVGRIYPAAVMTDSAGFAAGVSTMKHHMGATRMGADVRTSVVDGNLRTHAFENLYIGSSSVYPTGAYSNPTFTLLVLMYRLADHLTPQLRSR